MIYLIVSAAVCLTDKGILADDEIAASKWGFGNSGDFLGTGPVSNYPGKDIFDF